MKMFDRIIDRGDHSLQNNTSEEWCSECAIYLFIYLSETPFIFQPLHIIKSAYNLATLSVVMTTSCIMYKHYKR